MILLPKNSIMFFKGCGIFEHFFLEGPQINEGCFEYRYIQPPCLQEESCLPPRLSGGSLVELAGAGGALRHAGRLFLVTAPAPTFSSTTTLSPFQSSSSFWSVSGELEMPPKKKDKKGESEARKKEEEEELSKAAAVGAEAEVSRRRMFTGN